MLGIVDYRIIDINTLFRGFFYRTFFYLILEWVAQTSIKFRSQLILKCKFISCTFKINVSVRNFSIYNGENKLIFNEMMMRSALY